MQVNRTSICDICFNEMDGTVSGHIRDNKILHLFHQECLAKWVVGYNNKPNCPTCYEEISFVERKFVVVRDSHGIIGYLAVAMLGSFQAVLFKKFVPLVQVLQVGTQRLAIPANQNYTVTPFSLVSDIALPILSVVVGYGIGSLFRSRSQKVIVAYVVSFGITLMVKAVLNPTSIESQITII